MYKKHIVFFVDHKWRDLLISVYIKLLLEERGYRVTISRNGFESIVLPAIQPDAVIFNHVYEDKRVKVIKKFIKNGLKVIILPTENIPVLSRVKKLFAGAMADMSVVDLLFAWNKEVAESIGEEKTIDLEKVKIIGVPRFDVYRHPLSSLLMSKKDFLSKYGLNSNYPVITMTTNFTMASFAFKNKDFFKKDTEQLKTAQLGYNEHVVAQDFKSRELFHRSFLRLVNDYPEVNFIIKPHPSEDHTPYYDMLMDIKNRRIQGRTAVIMQEYIWDVLNATDILLERSCLTGLEAWVMGKPTVELHLNSDEWYHSPFMAGGSDEVFNYEQLRERIDYYLNGGVINSSKLKNRENVIKLWCHDLDGKASLRFVDEVDKFLQGQKKAVRRFSFADIKNYLLYYIFIFPDYRLLDMKLYKNWRKKIDKLGRTDKYFRNRDIRYWETKLKPSVEGAEVQNFIRKEVAKGAK